MKNPQMLPMPLHSHGICRLLPVLLFASVVFATGPGLRAQTPVVSTDKTNYFAGDDITVTFKNGPGNTKDWIGIYPAGATPGPNTPSTLWYYVDGTKIGTNGLANGTIKFTGGLAAAGQWAIQFLENDGYNSLATTTFTVKAKGPVPTVVADHSAYYPGDDITVTFSNGPGNPKDWVGIYPDGVTPGSVPSTIWNYVDGTQNGVKGFQQGTMTFPGGLALANDWDAFFLLNDGYTPLAQTKFSVVDPSSPLVRTDNRTYLLGQTIRVTFTNGPANPKDWIAIYKKDQVPGGPPATLWDYVDGTRTGASGVASGTLIFTNGLTAGGDYIAYFLANDGYTVLATDPFSVSSSTNSPPRILSLTPAAGSSNNPPVVKFSADITNGTTKVLLGSLKLLLDGIAVTPTTNQQSNLVTLSYTNTALFDPNSAHTFVLTFNDTASPSNKFTNTINFTIANYRNIVLPGPLYFENFDSTPEGQLPNGWTQTNYTDVVNPDFDLGNLESASYAAWTVVAADRFKGSFVTYSDPTRPAAEQNDYHRVLSINPLNVLNGQVVNEPLAKGNFVFSDSGYRHGVSQVMYLFTPDYNLAGKTNVYVSYYSLWEQNQDSIAALEYSVNHGTNWLPIVYMLDGPDVLRDPQGNVDAVATFTTSAPDIATYTDPVTGEQKGGTYGAFIGANITTNLAPFISARVNDDPVESKRIELFRLPQADNSAQVRFRFAHAGSDSWYWGIDNFGLYSLPVGVASQPTLSIAKSGGGLTLSWGADISGFVLESSDSLTAPKWTVVGGVTGNSTTIQAVGATKFYRLRK